MRQTRILFASLWLIGFSSFSAGGPTKADAAHFSVAPNKLIRMLVGTNYINDLALSPDHKLLAYQVLSRDVDTNAVTTAWWIVPVDQSRAPVAIADGGEAFGFDGMQDEKPTWSSNSKQIYYRKLENGQVQIWRTEVVTAKSQQLTQDEADILPVYFEDQFLLDDDRHRLFYSVAATRAQTLSAEARERADGIHIDPQQQLSPPLSHNRYWNGRMATMRRDPVRFMSLLGADAPITVKVVDLETNQTHEASPAELAQYSVIKKEKIPVDVDLTVAATTWSLSADGRRVAIGDSKPVGDKIAGLVTTTVGWRKAQGGEVVSCADPRCTGPHINAVSWWDNDREILFFSRDLGRTHILSWNVAAGSVREVWSTTQALNPGIVRCCSGRSGSCPTVGEYAYCTASDANEPPALVEINLKSGVHRVMFDPNVELRRVAGTFNTKHMVWTDEFGRSFHGVLVTPSTNRDQRVPLVITSYNCGGFLVGASGREMPEFALADSNIAALCIDADDAVFERPYPGNKFRPIIEAAYQTVLDSWEAVVRKLVEQGIIDSAKVGISGHSFGDKAVWYALIHSTSFSAAIDNGGTDEDPMSYFTGGPHTIARNYYDAGARLPNPFDDPKGLWARLSPALNVSKIMAPVLVQVSDTEFDDIQELYTGMLDAKKPMDIYVFEGEGHQYREPHHLVARAERNLDWFRFWFQGFQDPNPAKASQYHDWEGFCAVQYAEHPQNKLPCVAN